MDMVNPIPPKNPSPIYESHDTFSGLTASFNFTANQEKREIPITFPNIKLAAIIRDNEVNTSVMDASDEPDAIKTTPALDNAKRGKIK